MNNPSSANFTIRRNTFILLCFIAAKFILQYILISPAYELQRDEYLHLDQANHLARGYISVPPVTSWIAYIIKLLGNGYFWVKFFPGLFGALTILLVWKIIEALKGGLFALVAGSLAILVSMILRVNILFQPNSSDIFFWTLVYFTVVKYISTSNSKWFFATGIAVGFGILSKYNIIFLLLGLLPAILLTKHRKVFLEKNFYLSMGLAVLIILPNLIWQYQNHFPTLHQLNELASTQLVNVKRSDFIKEQFLFFSSSIIIIIASFIAFFFYQPFRQYRLFFISYVITLCLFIFLKAKGYYAIGLYPVLICFGIVYLEEIFAVGWKKYVRIFIIIFILGGSIPLFLIAFPIQSPQEIQKNNKRYKDFGALRWEDGKDHALPQDFADMVGWKELAFKADSVYTTLTGKGKTLIVCDNYGQAGAINYYTTKDVRAVSFNADYINWFDLSEKFENLIRVKEAGESEEELKKTSPFFLNALIAGRITNEYAREYGSTIYVFTGAKIDIRERIRKEINEKKNYR